MIVNRWLHLLNVISLWTTTRLLVVTGRSWISGTSGDVRAATKFARSPLSSGRGLKDELCVCVASRNNFGSCLNCANLHHIWHESSEIGYLLVQIHNLNSQSNSNLIATNKQTNGCKCRFVIVVGTCSICASKWKRNQTDDKTTNIKMNHATICKDANNSSWVRLSIA